MRKHVLPRLLSPATVTERGPKRLLLASALPLVVLEVLLAVLVEAEEVEGEGAAAEAAAAGGGGRRSRVRWLANLGTEVKREGIGGA